MLVHQNQESEGTVSDTVTLTDRTVENTSDEAPVSSGIQLNSSGVLFTYQPNGGLSQITGEWLVSGSASGFFVQRTITVGTLETDPGAGFLQLNTTRDYVNLKSTNGSKTTTVFFEISSDVSGVPIVATATMTFKSIKTL